MALAATSFLLKGGAAGAGAIALARPSVEMAPMHPVPIARASQTTGPITLRGRVVEVYGDKFVLQDASGRMLVDTGPRAERPVLTAGALATVQGRFDDGFIHASFLVDPEGNVTELGPQGHPRHGPPPPEGADCGPPPLPPLPGHGPPTSAPAIVGINDASASSASAGR
jgi:hypothetical protein